MREPLSILGAPVATLKLTSDKPVAQVSCRLSEVRNDGQVTLVSYGLLNLTHDDSHETVTPLARGKKISARVQLNHCAYRFAVGSRIRLAVATGQWPIAWPAPERATLNLITGESMLTLPVRDDCVEDNNLPGLPPAEQSEQNPVTVLRESSPVVSIEEDLETGWQVIFYTEDEGTERFENHGWIHGHQLHRHFEIHPYDPTSAKAEFSANDIYGREHHLDVEIHSFLRMSSDAANFFIEASLEALENGTCVFKRNWNRKIWRDNV